MNNLAKVREYLGNRMIFLGEHYPERVSENLKFLEFIDSLTGEKEEIDTFLYADGKRYPRSQAGKDNIARLKTEDEEKVDTVPVLPEFNFTEIWQGEKDQRFGVVMLQVSKLTVAVQYLLKK